MIKLNLLLTPDEHIALIGSLIAQKYEIERMMKEYDLPDNIAERYLREKETILNLLEKIKN